MMRNAEGTGVFKKFWGSDAVIGFGAAWLGRQEWRRGIERDFRGAHRDARLSTKLETVQVLAELGATGAGRFFPGDSARACNRPDFQSSCPFHYRNVRVVSADRHGWHRGFVLAMPQMWQTIQNNVVVSHGSLCAAMRALWIA
jgi:hypothetical protein